MVVVLAVAAGPVLAAVLYISVLGFGPDTDNMAPAVSFTRTSVADGYKLTIVAISRVTSWDDVGIVLSDGVSTASWSPSSTDFIGNLNASSAEFWHGGIRYLDSLQIWTNVTDLVGNGNVDGGDYITITTGAPYGFVLGRTYTLTLMYEPGGGMMGGYSWTV